MTVATIAKASGSVSELSFVPTKLGEVMKESSSRSTLSSFCTDDAEEFNLTAGSDRPNVCFASEANARVSQKVPLTLRVVRHLPFEKG